MSDSALLQLLANAYMSTVRKLPTDTSVDAVWQVPD